MIAKEDFTDITYEMEDGVAIVTINRPDRYNALRGRTVDELIYAFRYAWVDNSVGAIVLTGAGEKAFCSGGDQKERAATGGYGETEMGMFEIERLHRFASTNAKFGQVGPRVGSFDAGFGTAYLARVVGEKRAREIWFFCDQYDAATAERWGLVNRVVEPTELLSLAKAWGRRACALSPTALRTLKHSFNADSDHIVGIQSLAFDVLDLFVDTDEAKEGGRAFIEKRAPDFDAFR